MISSVSITMDANRLREPSSGTLVVERIADYATACVALRSAIANKKPLAVNVRNRVIAHWIGAYAATFGASSVTITDYTPRTALSEKWHTPIPASISDADIMLSRLLDISLSSRSGQEFNDLVLSHFYGELMAHSTFPLLNMAHVLNGYDEDKWKQAGCRPVVARALKERLQQWWDLGQNDSIRTLVSALRDDPGGLRRDLRVYKLLQNYPAHLGQKLLGSHWDAFRKLKVDPDPVDLAHDTSDVIQEIKYYLTGVSDKVATLSDLQDLLQEMSGWLPEEFGFVEDLLRKNAGWISSDLLRSIEMRFSPICSRFGQTLSNLRGLIQPPFPNAPDSDWTASEWLTWVRESYMPYYSWLEAQNTQNDIIAEYAGSFADWYFANFPVLKNSHPECFAYGALYMERDRIKQADAVTLVLLIDNFNFVYFETLCQIFQAQGILRSSDAPLFSLIPTATVVNKAALIAGTANMDDVLPNGYPALVAQQWHDKYGKKKAAYLPNIGAFQAISQLNSDIYFLNFLPIDEALHQDAQVTGRPHSEIIYDYLTTIAKSVANFAKQFQLEKRLGVYVISDHGSTRIARDVVNVLDKNFYKPQAEEKHHRFISVNDEKFNALPQMVEQQCYKIDRHTFDTKHNYLAARRYYRFLTTSDSFYVHGGLMPEEVVVPFARFTLTSIVPKPPTISMPKAEFRYKPEQVFVEIGNPNSIPLEAISVRLIGYDAQEIHLEKLAPNQKTTIQFTTVFRKTTGGSDIRVLPLRVKYACQGSEYTATDREFQVTLKPMIEEKRDNDDILDF